MANKLGLCLPESAAALWLHMLPGWLHNHSVFFEIRVCNGRVEISLSKDTVMHGCSTFMVLFLWFISAVFSHFTFRLGAAV